MSDSRPSDSRPFARLYRDAVEHARLLRDDGVMWRVYELPASMYDRRRGSSLIFEHETAIRRVRDYPTDWRSLDDAELLVLKERA